MGTFVLELAQSFVMYLHDSFTAMTWIDLLDVAFMTVFLSFGVMLLQRRASRSILFAVLSLLITFVTAQSLKMTLTSKMLQIGLTAFSLGLVIVFQEDFRRAFESLSSWQLWGRSQSFLSAKLTDTLVECLYAFGKSKTGALIVIGGRQPLDGHLRAGIPLQGQISGPLLESIFDPNSSGHDGAVIILNGVLDRFGVHLPLSRDAQNTGRLGTRHAAALGLAEKSDALILVVSEETGTVSIAQRGKLTPAKSISEVRDAIRAQSKRLQPSPQRSLMEIPWLRLTASLVISFTLWTTFARPANLVAQNAPVPDAGQPVAPPNSELVKEPAPETPPPSFK